MWNPDQLQLALLPLAQDTSSLGGTTGPDLTRYFTVCAVLILSTIGVAWGLRRLVHGSIKTKAAKRSLQVIDVLGLGGKRKIAVVRCYDRTFALGLGEREVTPIAELDAVIGSELPQPTGPKSEREAFERALDQVRASLPGLGGPKPKQPRAPQPPAAAASAPEKLTRKVIRRKKPKQLATEAVTEAGRRAAVASSAAATPQTAAARKREAQAVASAARRIADSKRKREGGELASAALRKTAAASRERDRARSAAATNTNQARQTPEPERPRTPRLEGILG